MESLPVTAGGEANGVRAKVPLIGKKFAFGDSRKGQTGENKKTKSCIFNVMRISVDGALEVLTGIYCYVITDCHFRFEKLRVTKPSTLPLKVRPPSPTLNYGSPLLA